MLLEVGTRVHITEYAWEKDETASPFALKLRKHFRGKRLEDVRQLGMDRVIDFAFGHGDATYHLICEFYAAGNVIATDANYKILVLIRSHHQNPNVPFSVGDRFPMEDVRPFVPIGVDALEHALEQGKKEKLSMKKTFSTRLPSS